MAGKEVFAAKKTAVSFVSGSILKAAMLRAAIGAQAEFLRLAYLGYGPGILRGMELRPDTHGDLWMTPGIVHALDGTFFLCEAPVNLTAFLCQRDSGEWSPCSGNLLVLHTDPAGDPREGVRTQAMRLGIHDAARPVLQDDELLLLTFHGAKVRPGGLTLPRELRDFSPTNEADVNVLAQPHACIGGTTTFPPLFFRVLAQTVAAKEEQDTLDEMLLLLLTAQNVLPLATLERYCKAKHVPIPRTADQRKDLLDAVQEAVKQTIAAPAAPVAADKPAAQKNAPRSPRWRTRDADQI